jgi:hypothetical protein
MHNKKKDRVNRRRTKTGGGGDQVNGGRKTLTELKLKIGMLVFAEELFRNTASQYQDQRTRRLPTMSTVLRLAPWAWRACSNG